MRDNPVLVEVLRGDCVESVHRGALAIVDADGRLVASVGDIERPILPRSAVKPIQALYLVESGAADHYGLTTEEIALACASHNGALVHVQGAETMLGRADLTEICLECGAHWPRFATDRTELVKADARPNQLYNNCSGKHAGFILTAKHLGEEIKGYVNQDHPVQHSLKVIMDEISGFSQSDPAFMATDGCSIPTYGIPLKNMAHALARMAAATNMGALRDRAARRIYEACTNAPHMVAGENRFDTVVMRALGKTALIKTGAEGVYAGIIPTLGFGVALKCDDGETRGSEVMMAAVLTALLPDETDKLSDQLTPSLKNRNGWIIGAIRPVDGLVQQLKDAALQKSS